MSTVKTFNGFTLNGSGYSAMWLNPRTLPAATLQFIEQAMNAPVYSETFSLAARNIALSVSARGANLYELNQALEAALAPGAHGELVVTLDDGLDYALECTVQSLSPKDKHRGTWTVMLQSGDWLWRAVTPSTDSWAVSGTSGSKTITVDGAAETRLSLTLTPGSVGASGWAYQELYQLVNTPGVAFGRRMWCVVMDTAALVTAGKMRSDCADLRVVINDGEVKRWISDPNTDHSHLWFAVDLIAGYEIEVTTSVPSSGAVGELQLKSTGNNKTAIKAMPNSGFLVHGTEWFQYAGKDINKLKVGIVARGALGTPQAAHATGSKYRYLQNVIYLVYGNPAATDPAVDDSGYDDDKPLFDLAVSDNSAWSWTSTSGFEDDAHPNRPGGWTRTLKRSGDLSDHYAVEHNADSGDAVMGARMACWVKNGRVQNEAATLTWQFNSPGGISLVSAAGEKYRNSARWPGKAALQRSPDGRSFVDAWNETLPVNVNTWTAFTRNAQAIAAGSRWVQFVLYGSLAALADAAALFEVQSCTVTFTAGTLPTGTRLGQVQNYMLDVKISNLTTGERIDLRYPMLIGKSLVVDGEEYGVTYDGLNAHGALILDNPGRDVWLSLAKGSNQLSIESASGGTLTIGLSWRKRRP